MLFAVAIKGLEDCGREVPNKEWFAAGSLRSVEVGRGFDADDLGSRARHALRLDAEATAQIVPNKHVIPVLGKRAQKRGGISALVLLPLHLNDEVGPANDLGYPHLRGLKADSFLGGNHIEDTVSFL